MSSYYSAHRRLPDALQTGQLVLEELDAGVKGVNVNSEGVFPLLIINHVNTDT